MTSLPIKTFIAAIVIVLLVSFFNGLGLHTMSDKIFSFWGFLWMWGIFYFWVVFATKKSASYEENTNVVGGHK